MLISFLLFRSLPLMIGELEQAQQESSSIVTDRPDFTESSLVIEPGKIQVESGVTLTRESRRDESIQGMEILLRAGLCERFELRLGIPNFTRVWSESSRTMEGFADTYLGVKYSLANPESDFQAAVIPAVFIPSGREGIRGEAAAPELKLVFSKALPREMSLSGMVYAAWLDEGGSRAIAWQHTLSLGFPIHPRLAGFVEFVLELQKSVEPGPLLHSGLVFMPCNRSQFDLHAGIGLTRSAQNVFVGAGYSVRF